MAVDRYEVIGAEWLFEPGSKDQVLKNKLGITDPAKMEEVEFLHLLKAENTFRNKFSSDHQFKCSDLLYMHKEWLGPIYEMAGKYREVNVSKEGFAFASTQYIPSLMKEFEEKYLAKFTPCKPGSRREIAEALAITHVELIVIHPFREGNGRTSRELATLMAHQSGLPTLNYDSLMGDKKPNYISAVHSGFSGDMSPMISLFENVIEKSLSLAEKKDLEQLKWHHIDQTKLLDSIDGEKMKIHLKGVLAEVEIVANRSPIPEEGKIKVCHYFEGKESVPLLLNEQVAPQLKVATAWVRSGGDLSIFSDLNKKEIEIIQSLGRSKSLDRGRDL